MYFSGSQYLTISGDFTTGSGFTIEMWLRTLEDVNIANSEIFKIQKDSGKYDFEAFFGANCKCITVQDDKVNGAITTGSASTFGTPAFLGISL